MLLSDQSSCGPNPGGNQRTKLASQGKCAYAFLLVYGPGGEVACLHKLLEEGEKEEEVCKYLSHHDDY